MDVVGQVGADSLLGERKLAGPMLHKSVNVFETMIAGADHVLCNAVAHRAAPGDSGAPDGGDEGKAGQIAPFFGKVQVNELLACAFEPVCALFESHQSRIADEDGRVRSFEHGVKFGGHGYERHVRVPPFVKEDARVSDGGSACGIGCDAADFGNRL